MTLLEVDRSAPRRALFRKHLRSIGSDAFAEIGTWYRSTDVIRAVEFIVVTRPGHDYTTPPGARVERLETVALPVSSSEIDRLGCGQADRLSARLCY